MKLSELDFDRGIDVIADIIPPIAEIASDPACAALFDASSEDGESAAQAVLRRIRTNVPSLLKSHKSAVVAVLAEVNGLSVEEYTATHKVIAIIRDAIGILNDPELVSLFTYALTGQDEPLSAGASEHSEVDQ